MTLPDGTLHPTEQRLLDALGDVDPAESQMDVADHWVTLVDQAGQLVWVRPHEGEWSALEILAHVTTVELTNALRYRAMLVEESPVLADYGTTYWSSVLTSPGIQPLALLQLFRALRYDNLEFWAHLDEAGRARVGIHQECGPETIELRFKMLAGHDRQHLDQARRALALVRVNRPT